MNVLEWGTVYVLLKDLLVSKMQIIYTYNASVSFTKITDIGKLNCIEKKAQLRKGWNPGPVDLILYKTGTETMISMAASE